MSIRFHKLTDKETVILMEQFQGQRVKIGTINHDLKTVFINYVGQFSVEELFAIYNEAGGGGIVENKI